MRPFHHEGSHIRRPTCARALWTAVLVLGSVWAVSAQAPAGAPSYRVFLKDGTPLVSYGEVAHAGGRAVFTVAVGLLSDPAALQVVSLPESVVDWDHTNRYAEAVRRVRYASALGEADYLQLTGEVARALSDMAFAPDPATKLRIGEEARRRLMLWPDEHFDYRSASVRELTALVEETMSDVRANSGQGIFDLNLVATVTPPDERLLPEPTLEDLVTSASAIARLTDTHVERVSLQQAILSALVRPEFRSSGPWVRSADRLARHALDAEAQLDRRYADLSRRSLDAASRHVADGNVVALEQLIVDVRQKDPQLLAGRPDEVSALVASLASKVEAARATRLALDRWQYRQQTWGGYRRGIDATVKRLGALTRDLDAVRRLAGPDPKRLSRAERRVSEAEVGLLTLDPPADLREAHGALVASVQLMREAMRLRREALASGSMDVAHNASSAAAGAVLLLDSAREHIAQFFRKPALP